LQATSRDQLTLTSEQVRRHNSPPRGALRVAPTSIDWSNAQRRRLVSTTVLAAAGSTVWRSVTVSHNRVRVRALSSPLKKNERTQNWTEYAHADAASVSDLLSRITANEADTAHSLSNCRTMPKRIILIAIEFS